MMRLVLLLMAMCSAIATRGEDVERYQILKGRHYFQVGAGGPILQTNNTYRFNVAVYATTNGNVKGGSIIPPNGAGQNLLADLDGDPYRVRERFDEPHELERFFPNGGYVLNLQTLHDGNRSLTHSISGDAYPSPPYLANYEAVQNLPYNYYSEIIWAPFPGGTTNDFIQVQIEKANGDAVFETPDFGKVGALNGLATRVLLEPGDLTSGVTYIGTITFTRVLQSGSAAYPGVPGAIGYFSRTEFTVRSVASSVVPAVDRIEVWEMERFLQTTNSLPEHDVEGWSFRARVDATAVGIATNATFLSPKGTNVALAFDGLMRFEHDEDWATRTEMQNAYPAGDYKFTMQRSNGIAEQWTVPLPAGQFPPVPVLSGLPVGLHEATQPITISWTPWVGSSEMDFIRVELSDAFGTDTFESPGFTSSKRLRGDATGITIPTTALLPGRTYRLDVTFRKVAWMETRAIPGGLALSGYATRTRFVFATVPRDVEGFGISLSRTAWQRGPDLYTYDDPPFTFEAILNASSPNVVTTASLTLPNNATLALTPMTNGLGLATKVSQGWDSALAYFPTGAYSFRYGTVNNGSKTSVVTLASKEFPPQPKLRNFSSLGTVTGGPTASFPISWEPWVDARLGKDFVRLIIEDMKGLVVLDTGAAGSVDAQAGTNTTYGIFGALLPLRSYVAKLRFESLDQFEYADYPGPIGKASVFSETQFYISTLGPARFTIPRNSVVKIGMDLQFAVSPTLSNRLYRIEVKTDSIGWTPVQTNLSPNGGNFRITIPRSTENTFIRAAVLP